MTSPTPSNIRNEFPIFKHHDVCYLDSAATTQRPQCVINAAHEFDSRFNAPANRGLYDLGYRATQLYEEARSTIAGFFGAKNEQGWVFTSGATASVNLCAQSYLAPMLAPGDEIILTQLEHHANIVPWLMLKEQHGLVIKVVPTDQHGHMDLDVFQSLFSDKTRLVSMVHVSNVTGVINPVKKIIELSHEHGVPVLLDGAQAGAHIEVNIDELDCDFYVASSHKMYGPTGVGALYAKKHLWQSMRPSKGGGNMVSKVSFDGFSFMPAPHGFEAGTQAFAQAYGWMHSVKMLERLTMAEVVAHDQALKQYLVERLKAIEGLTLYGGLEPHVGVVSFALDDIHPHDIATILDQHNIAIRAGHHCCMPMMQALDVSALARVSIGIYNEPKDVDRLIGGLLDVKEVFRE